jgi:hypothetical protein
VSPTWRRDPQALWRRSGDRVIVLSPSGEAPIVLTGPGRVSWELLHEALPEDELIGALAEIYGTDQDTIGRDLVPFLQELATAGAVAGA